MTWRVYTAFKFIPSILITPFSFIFKSITSDFSDTEIKQFSSDLIISSATIEHVGCLENQKKIRFLLFFYQAQLWLHMKLALMRRVMLELKGH